MHERVHLNHSLLETDDRNTTVKSYDNLQRHMYVTLVTQRHWKRSRQSLALFSLACWISTSIFTVQALEYKLPMGGL